MAERFAARLNQRPAPRAADALDRRGLSRRGTNTRRRATRVERGWACRGRSARTWSQARRLAAKTKGDWDAWRNAPVRSPKSRSCGLNPRRHSRACPARQKGEPRSRLLVALGRARRRPEDAASRSRAWAGKARAALGVRCSTIFVRRGFANAGAGRHRRARPGLEKGGWRRCGPDNGCPTLHPCTSHRNLLAHAPRSACTKEISKRLPRQ